jgi:hypothetical protein
MFRAKRIFAYTFGTIEKCCIVALVCTFFFFRIGVLTTVRGEGTKDYFSSKSGVDVMCCRGLSRRKDSGRIIIMNEFYFNTAIAFRTTRDLPRSRPGVQARGPELRIVRRFIERWLGVTVSPM